MDKEHIMLEARVLRGQGKTQVEIAEILGVCERAVRNHLAIMPRARKKPSRGSRLDPFKGKIDEILEVNAYDEPRISDRNWRMNTADQTPS